MANFIAEMMRQPVAGIPLGAWQRFIRIFADNISEEVVANRLRLIASAFRDANPSDEEAQQNLDAFASAFEALLHSLTNPPQETS